MADFTQRGPEGTYFNAPKPNLEERQYWGDPNLDKEEIKARVVDLLDGDWTKSPKIGSRDDIDPVVRARMIEDIGAPPMKVVSWRTLDRLGRIPRSSEGEAVSLAEALHEVYEHHKDAPRPYDCYDKRQAPFGGAFPPEWSWPLFDSRTGGMPRVRFVMVSHRWTRPNIDSNKAHPDDEAGTKAQLLVDYARKWYDSILKFETYFWIDFACVNQDDKDINGSGIKGIYSLPLYVSTCTGGMVVIGSPELEERAWCRLEQLVYCSVCEKPFFNTLPHPKSLGPASIPCADKHNWKKKLQDPRLGLVTYESDRKQISDLTDLVSKYWGHCWARSTFNTSNLNNVERLEFNKTEVHMGSES